MEEFRKRNIWQLGVGVFLVIAGCILLLDRFDIFTFGSAWRFWPLIVITVGLGRVADAHDSRERSKGFFWIFIGSWLLAAELHLFGLTYHNSWPILLIGVGVSMLVRSTFGTSRHTVVTENTHAS
jgi:hypothetical protein